MRYIAHLTAPGLDVIGAGEPCAPGISFGHNGLLAFSGTIFYIDQEDVFVLTKDGPEHFVEAGQRKPIRTETETVAVKGHGERQLTLRFCEHGPIVWENERIALAVRSVAQEPGTAPYLGSLSGMRETTVAGYAASLHRNKTPSTNHVFADRSGSIAWRPAGLAPRRVGHDGLLPVPADGQHRWDGFLSVEDMPLTVDPPCGWVASANAYNLPDGWDHAARPIGYEWVEYARLRRIQEVLGQASSHNAQDAAALQTDVVSMPARRLAKLVAAMPGWTPRVLAAQRLLHGWDGALAADSAAACFIEVWWMKHLKPGLLNLLVPDAELRPLLVPVDNETALALLESPDARFGAEPHVARDRLLLSTIEAAWTDLSARLGRDERSWRWGALHHAHFEHALAALPGAAQAGLADVGRWPMGGSSSSPMHTGYRLSDFRVIAGASFRMIVDLADPDRSLCINSPGQSGDPRSPHYGDLAPLWAAGRYVPMLFSKDAVEAAVTQRIRLEP